LCVVARTLTDDDARAGNHPCVVKFIGVCTKQGHFCIVSEFCAKGSLERLVRGNNRASLPLRTIVQMARDAAAGILHLHCESVIHRVRHAPPHTHTRTTAHDGFELISLGGGGQRQDIAARNIMIGDNYSAHVGDFGFARVKDKNASSAFTSTIGPVRRLPHDTTHDQRHEYTC
jgi:serine/threonine protein kinase